MNRKELQIVRTAAETLSLNGYKRDAKRLEAVIAKEVRSSAAYEEAFNYANADERVATSRAAEAFAYFYASGRVGASMHSALNEWLRGAR